MPAIDGRKRVHMLPIFLLPGRDYHPRGRRRARSELRPAARADPLLITLGITRIIEQQSLDISIWGSAGGSDWGAKKRWRRSPEVLLRRIPDRARPVRASRGDPPPRRSGRLAAGAKAIPGPCSPSIYSTQSMADEAAAVCRAGLAAFPYPRACLCISSSITSGVRATIPCCSFGRHSGRSIPPSPPVRPRPGSTALRRVRCYSVAAMGAVLRGKLLARRETEDHHFQIVVVVQRAARGCHFRGSALPPSNRRKTCSCRPCFQYGARRPLGDDIWKYRLGINHDSSPGEALDLFRSDDPRRDRPWRPMPCAAAGTPKASSPISSTATSTTQLLAPSTCNVSAPSTGPMGHAEGYILPQETIFPEDPGDHRPGRHRRADAGRAAPRSQDRMVTRTSSAALKKALRHPPALPLGAGGWGTSPR